jgi:hypothetical protein
MGKYGEEKIHIDGLGGKTRRKKLVEVPRRRQEDNIKLVSNTIPYTPDSSHRCM